MNVAKKMDSQCRLCLETSDDFVNIFDDLEDPPIALVLTQHFWFQINKNDGLSECLCHTCWTNVRTFHNFYKKIELLQIDYWNSVEKVSADADTTESNSCSDLIKQEQSSSEAELNLVKYEELPLDVIVHTNKDESSDYNSCERSEKLNISDNDSPHPIKKRDRKTKAKQMLTPNRASKRKRTAPYDNSEMDAQIREFFTMKCDICTDVAFETYTEARKHYRKIHKTSGHLICCGKKFHRRCLVLEHIQHHLNPDAYRCDLCAKQFLDNRALESHIKNHEPRTSRAFKCSLCSSSFTKAVGLKSHMQNTHASKKGGKFPCDKCNKICQSKLSLACHIRYIHELEPTFICDTCARAFKTKTLLLAHIQVHSATPLPKVQCNVCGAWLKNKMSLVKHVKRHQDAHLNCPICEKTVKNKLALNSHILQVHGERRHHCTFCDKAFKTPRMLKEHVAIHTGEYLYNCPYCEKKCKSGANMFTHRKKAHFAEWTRDRAKQVEVK